MSGAFRRSGSKWRPTPPVPRGHRRPAAERIVGVAFDLPELSVLHVRDRAALPEADVAEGRDGLDAPDGESGPATGFARQLAERGRRRRWMPHTRGGDAQEPATGEGVHRYRRDRLCASGPRPSGYEPGCLLNQRLRSAVSFLQASDRADSALPEVHRSSRTSNVPLVHGEVDLLRAGRLERDSSPTRSLLNARITATSNDRPLPTVPC